MQPDDDLRDGQRLLSTRELLPLVRQGDRTAAGELFARFAPALRRLLHARLPGRARGLLETDDLVQDVWARAPPRINGFDYRGPGSFWAYLRRIGLNELGLVAPRESPASPGTDETAGEAIATGTGPLSRLVKEERFRAFENALERLSDVQRQALLMRIELQVPYEAIAEECGFPSPAAARMVVCRAMEKIVETLSREGHAGE